MSGKLSFTGAVQLWNDTRTSPDDTRWAAFSRAEAVILDHRPASPAEALHIVAVLLDQGGDPRTDGRDRTALSRLHDFLAAQARVSATAAAFLPQGASGGGASPGHSGPRAGGSSKADLSRGRARPPAP